MPSGIRQRARAVADAAWTQARRIGSVLSAAALAASVGGASIPADAATGTPRLQRLAEAQTRLYAALDNNTGVPPPSCGQGQPLKGVRGVFLLPVFASTDAPEPMTLECTTTAHKVLVDAGGFAVTEATTVRAGPAIPRRRVGPVQPAVSGRNL